MTRMLPMSCLILLCCFPGIGVVSASADPAQLAPAVEFAGALPRAQALTLPDLEQLGPTDIDWTHAEVEHRFRGVRLETILALLGWSDGPTGPDVTPSEKHAGLRLVLRAHARDGFEAVFSIAELASGFGPSEVWLVWMQDCVPLPEEDGPFRLIVPTDQRGARSIRQLESIEVIDLDSPTEQWPSPQ